MRLRTTETAPPPLSLVRPAPHAAAEASAPETRTEAPHRVRKRPRKGHGAGLSGSEALLLWLGFGIPGLALLATGVYTALNAAPIEPPVRRAPLPANNAYPVVALANELVVERKSAGSGGTLPSQKKAPLTLAARRALLQQNAAALGTLRTALGRPFAPPRTVSFDVGAGVNYTGLRRLAETLLLESGVRRDSGDLAGAAASLLDGVELEVMAPNGGGLLARLIAASAESRLSGPLWTLADQLSASDAAAAARRLEALNAKRLPYLETVREEDIGTHEALREALSRQSTFEFVRRYFGTGEGSGQGAQGIALRAALVPRQVVLRNHTLLSQNHLALAALPWRSAARNAPYTGPIDPINEFLHPNSVGGELRDREVRAISALLTVRLALRTYYLSHGAYPEALGTLVKARLLRAIPTDPFDEGQPLRYRSKGGYPVFYSVGPDGLDNGGSPVPRKIGESLSPNSLGDIVSAR